MQEEGRVTSAQVISAVGLETSNLTVQSLPYWQSAN